MCVNSLCAVIALWLNASQRRRVDVGMNTPARWLSVKCTELSNGLDTALCTNILVTFLL